MQKPMWYTVSRATPGETHLETTLQVLFVLSGEMSVRYQDQDILMHTEDILSVYMDSPWTIVSATDAMYGIASYDVAFVSTMLGTSMPFFMCNSAMDRAHSYQDLRDLFFQLTAEYTAKPHRTELTQSCLLLEILNTIMEHYQVNVHDARTTESVPDERMDEIMRYVIQNLNQEINLTELAEKMYVSPSTLSRIFKKNKGVYFADYVMQLRVRASVPQIAYTDLSLTQVALNNGFSTSATFTRAFRKYMQMTPSEYREKYRAQAEDRKREQEELEASLRKELREMGYETVQQSDSDELVLDLKTIQGVPLPKVWDHVLNLGAVFELTNASVQFQVIRLREQLGFDYARVWKPFSERLLFTDGREITEYNFDLIDQALDFLVHEKLKPFIVFGRRPAAASRTDEEAVFFADDYVHFENKQAWENAIRAYLQHIVHRYGVEEVSSWIFELSFDAMHESQQSAFWSGGDFKYIDAYTFMYQEVRTQTPGARFGARGADITVEWKSLNEFLQQAVGMGMVPDFLSFVMFPYDTHRHDQGRYRRKVSCDPENEEKQVALMRQLMHESGVDTLGVQLWITEWNNSLSNRNCLNDSMYRAAYLVYKISKIWNKIGNISVMAGSDWISSYMDAPRMLSGSVGLLSKDGIRKPAFYALDFLNRLGSRLLAQGEHYLATQRESGSLSILCFHYSRYRGSIYNQREDLDLQGWQKLRYENDHPVSLKIRIENPGPPGTYLIKRHVLNDQHGSVLEEWARFEFDPQLTRQDVKYIDSQSVPMIVQSKVKIERPWDCIELEVVMRPEELTFLHIYRQN